MRKNALLTLGASMLLILSSCQKEHNAPDTPEKVKPGSEEIDKGKPEKAPDDTTDDHKKDDTIPPTEKDDKKPETPSTEKDDKKPETPSTEKDDKKPETPSTEKDDKKPETPSTEKDDKKPETPSTEKDNKKPETPPTEKDDKKPERPSDRDIANRLSVAWKVHHDIEKKITLDVDALFDHNHDASFTTAQLSKFVVFQATAVNSNEVYTLTEEDLQKLTLSGFRYENDGLIKFEARYRDRSDIRLSLPFSREKYYSHKVRPKDASRLFMHGVHHNPDLFTSDLFGYDATKYEVHIKNSVSNTTSLDLSLSVDRKDHDGHLAMLTYQIDSFKPLSHLNLTISPQSEVSAKIVRYYRQGRSTDRLNQMITQWIKQINFVLTRDHEDIELLWETDAETGANVLVPESHAKKYADIYFVNPRFTVTEVQELSDAKLRLKVKLNQIGETEVKNTDMDLIVTIPSK